MMDSRPKSLIIVDDLSSVSLGMAMLLGQAQPELEIETMTFEELGARTDFTGIDYVIVDLAQANGEDPTAHEYPCWYAVPHIREHAPGRGPWVIVVTGEAASFSDPLVNRMVKEIGADFFIERTSLERQLPDIFARSSEIRPNLIEPALAEQATPVDPSMGVGQRTKLAPLHDFLVDQDLGRFAGKGGGVGRELRRVAEVVSGVAGVSKGSREPTSKTPASWHWAELKQRLTRIPRR